MRMSDSDRETAINLADLANESGDAIGALRIIVTAITNDPTWGLAKVHAAKYSFAAKLHGDCIKFSDEVISARPKSSVGHYYKARALNELGQKEAAIEGYRRGLLCGSRKQNDAIYHLGVCLLEMGKFQEAKGVFPSLVVQCEPGSDQHWYAISALFKLGLCCMELGQDTEAMEYFTDYLKENPDCEATLENMKILKNT